MVILYVVPIVSHQLSIKGFAKCTSLFQRCLHRRVFHGLFARKTRNFVRVSSALEERTTAQPSVYSNIVVNAEPTNVFELPCGAKRLEDAPCGDGVNCPFIKYKCKRGHIVKALKGTPVCKVCPLCTYEAEAELCPELRRGSTKPLSLETMQRIASRRGGLCLSKSYTSVRDKFLWRCSEGHEWVASGDNVRRGSWCPTCARKTQTLDLSELNEMAKERGGRCLSTEYKNVHHKLKWECSQGHIFMMSANNIRRKGTSSRPPSWCPICAKIKRSEKRKKCSSTTCDAIFVREAVETTIRL